MNDQRHQLAQAATQLANRMPYGVLVSLADAIARFGDSDWSVARTMILHQLSTAEFRDVAATFVDLWKRDSHGLNSEVVATALIAVARADHEHRAGEIVELVWTGPEATGTHFRHTEQAILEVLNSATNRLTVVSYAVYRIPRIRDALIAAATRGVRIKFVVETPNRIEGQSEYDCLLALGSAVSSVVSVYYWPQENRARDDNGKLGILHVKCAVADGTRLFLSSANLTDYAFTINMELGLLVTGGKQPERVELQFDQLINSGVLVRVARSS